MLRCLFKRALWRQCIRLRIHSALPWRPAYHPGFCPARLLHCRCRTSSHYSSGGRFFGCANSHACRRDARRGRHRKKRGTSIGRRRMPRNIRLLSKRPVACDDRYLARGHYLKACNKSGPRPRKTANTTRNAPPDSLWKRKPSKRASACPKTNPNQQQSVSRRPIRIIDEARPGGDSCRAEKCPTRVPRPKNAGRCMNASST